MPLSISLRPSYAPSSYTCSSLTISINITTDGYPLDTAWEIFNENNKAIFTGGPYNKSYKTFKFNRCISEGSFKFKIKDSFWDGIGRDRGYVIRINDEIIKEGSSSNGFLKIEVFSFEIHKLSDYLSISPSIVHPSPISKPMSKKKPTSKRISKKKPTKKPIKKNQQRRN